MTLSYELAKELKDAGFPQNLDGNKQMNGQSLRWHFSDAPHPACDDCVYSPTLSELIEACGDRFFGLRVHTKYGGWWKSDTKGFAARAFEPDNRDELKETGWGTTRDEAVARLWLALNNKE
jgi:hypothetical protein